MKQYKRICKWCGKEFFVDGKSRSGYCSDWCRSEHDRKRCLNHYYKVIKPGLVKKGEIKPPKDKVFVKIKITKQVPVFAWLSPKVGAVYTAQKVNDGQYAEKTSYIIRDIGKHGLLIRRDECEELSEEDVVE